eukprot:TRINITY_DN5395_c0_g2_i1.p1 TRINITY_DN5395_c0_g2~~TRINITY_DN5395_c0_g2_i1.p1  ORF type:complete len:104 (-),score=21.61 TRINITY_DN5395_c0_g2_i1:35-313(-)
MSHAEVTECVRNVVGATVKNQIERGQGTFDLWGNKKAVIATVEKTLLEQFGIKFLNFNLVDWSEEENLGNWSKAEKEKWEQKSVYEDRIKEL